MNNKGISILKVLFIISICVIILVVNIIILNHYRAKHRDAVRIADMSLIQSAMNMLYTDQGTYKLGENCQSGSLLKQQGCASVLSNYINMPAAFTDPFANNTVCTWDLCNQRVCEYTAGEINDEGYIIFFHLEKGIEGLGKGCHYLDQAGLH